MNTFDDVAVYPTLSDLPDFDNNLPPPFEDQEDQEMVAGAAGWTFFEFLNEWRVHYSPELWWKFDNDNEVISFGLEGRKLFLGLAEILISYHMQNKFSGNLVHKIRILPDLNVTHESSPVENGVAFINGGQLNDIKHFRWMVATVVREYFPNYTIRLSSRFRLFFSEIFTHDEGVRNYFVCQLYHPIFFNSSDRFNLIGMIKDLYDLNKVIFKDRFELARYGFGNWFGDIVNGVLRTVLNHKNNYKTLYSNEDSGYALPLYIRNVHAHFCQGVNFHQDIDSELDRLFPGVSAAIIDTSIRDFHGYWGLFGGLSLPDSQCSPPYGWCFPPYR